MKARSIKTGVIAAAGKGTRAYPRTTVIPKPLFIFEGESILARNVRLQFEQIGVEKIYIIVGHLKEVVLDEIEKIRKLYPGRELIPVQWTGKGLAADVASLEAKIEEDFILILGDEFYHRTNHRKLLQSWKAHNNGLALIAIMKSRFLSNIRKNYSVELSKDRVMGLIEKPADPPNNLLGLGTYLFSPEYFSYYHRTPVSPRTGVVELTDVIDRMARESKSVYATVLDGEYFNINSLADYYHSTYLIRSEKFASYKITLIISSTDDPATLPDVLSDFVGMVHEIIIVDSSEQTIALPRSNGKTRMRVVKSVRAVNQWIDATGLYEAMHRADGDIFVIVPADGSFRASDLPKLLEYLKDSDMVIGTRTTRQMIEQGANMRPFARWANVFLGKLVEVLWWSQEPRFTDVGCLYRAIWRDAFNKIYPELHEPGSLFSVEMMIEIIRSHMRSIEIPVSYFKRQGGSNPNDPEGKPGYFFSVARLALSRRFRLFERLFGSR